MPTQIKGQVFHSFEAVVRARLGDAVWQQLVEDVPAELRVRLELRSLVVTGWYPMRWYGTLHDALERRAADFAPVLGLEGTERDIGLLFRWVLRLFSPNTLLRQSERVVGGYLRGATVTVRDEGPTSAELTLVTEDPCARGMWREFAEGTRTFLAPAGARDVTATVRQGGAAGDDRLVLGLAWRE